MDRWHHIQSPTNSRSGESPWEKKSPPDEHGPKSVGEKQVKYPLVNKHSNGKSPFSIGNTSSNGGFSIAMLDYRSVYSSMNKLSYFINITSVFVGGKLFSPY